MAEFLRQNVDFQICVGHIHHHDHGEQALKDVLCYFQNVDVMLCTGTADTGQDPHAVFSDNGDNSFHNKYLSSGRIDLDSGMIIS